MSLAQNLPPSSPPPTKRQGSSLPAWLVPTRSYRCRYPRCQCVFTGLQVRDGLRYGVPRHLAPCGHAQGCGVNEMLPETLKGGAL